MNIFIEISDTFIIDYIIFSLSKITYKLVEFR